MNNRNFIQPPSSSNSNNHNTTIISPYLSHPLSFRTQLTEITFESLENYDLHSKVMNHLQSLKAIAWHIAYLEGDNGNPKHLYLKSNNSKTLASQVILLIVVSFLLSTISFRHPYYNGLTARLARPYTEWYEDVRGLRGMQGDRVKGERTRTASRKV